ncbi:hypothetical protein M9H77_04007 [Catharanthus roseus]|uniref:Uncharacterized protein n=1 Tax=Catharanthus roseus TaxID=4058 RepID=A0ACC0CD19_CATRO|nr:hypothetical protein M9H77_04007 [Catharanthus roseus]
MEGMEIIPNLFENIGWGPLIIVDELYYPEMIYEFYANLHKGRVQNLGDVAHQCVTSRLGGRDISFDDRMLNTILGIHENATQTSFKKCLPYDCFLTKVFQYFVVNLVGIGDHIGIGKIYNKHTFKRVGFSRNEEGVLVRERQEDDDENDDDKWQDAMNMDEEKKRQKKVEEGQSSEGIRFDALNGKFSYIQERVMRLESRGREEDN